MPTSVRYLTKLRTTRVAAKLKPFGVPAILYRWIEDFTRGRSFTIRASEFYSAWQELVSDVPQGFVSGLRMSLMFINQLHKIAKYL